MSILVLKAFSASLIPAGTPILVTVEPEISPVCIAAMRGAGVRDVFSNSGMPTN